ncbi:unnamed protein product [Kuraishia capsulata CBS 1993]|uniref:Mitochondrial import inner membrane translocase subunit TIM17 n=1 Tax=Kuraishia capsulata CBS 1993 TaxID=1382522 RepID=W6MN53_9ASCO|nr:uncharacterized protein KUCA_T00003662001 [Kuraishia capsulata CBS 1993]CDK27683.1 unnamed protein product [Kuraishia capsulata CBS 1993]
MPLTTFGARRLTVFKVIGGCVWHGIKGFRNSPIGERGSGAVLAIKARAPVVGGNFGVWGGLLSFYDCGIKHIRKREDPWNAIIAGFFTGGSIAIRGGWKHTRNSAITCACVLGVFEGVGMMFQRWIATQNKPMAIPEGAEMPSPPLAA